LDPLQQIHALESAFRWADVEELYEDEIKKADTDEEKASLISARARAEFRSALQAESHEEYRSLIAKASESASRAGGLLMAAGREGRATLLTGLNQYYSTYLVYDRLEALPLVQDTLRLFDRASDLSEKEADKVTVLEALMAWLELASLARNFGDTPEWRSYVSAGAQERGEKALGLVGEPGDRYSRARILTDLGGIQSGLGLHGSQDLAKRLLREAIQLAEGDPGAAIRADAWGELSYAIEGEVEEMKRATSAALKDAEKTGDKMVITGTLSNQISLNRYMMTLVEDSQEGAKLLEESRAFESKLRSVAKVTRNCHTAYARVAALADMLTITRLYAEFLSDASAKKSLLGPSIKEAEGSIGITKSPRWLLGYLYYSIANGCVAYASYETDRTVKGLFLADALKYAELQVQSFASTGDMRNYSWNKGVGLVAVGTANFELGLLEEGDVKKELLLKASKSVEDGIDLAGQFDALGGPMYLRLGQYSELSARIRKELRAIKAEPELGRSVVDILKRSVELYEKSGQPSRVAEGNWRLAVEFEHAGQFGNALESYTAAWTAYKKASESRPNLSGVYDDYASYMFGWGAVTAARSAHSAGKYKEAAVHFDDAAKAVGNTGNWSYLSANLAALASLERAENLSREERAADAVEAFKATADLFEGASVPISEGLARVPTTEEKADAREILEAIPHRKEYCAARVVLEEARIADKAGDKVAAGERYSRASELFAQLAGSMRSEHERLEIESIALLSTAWRSLMEAENESDPALYGQAALSFAKVKELAKTESLHFLSSGNSFYCQSLQMALEFKLTGNRELYSRAKSYMDQASDLYKRAGYDSQANWAKATQRVFDAYVYMGAAQNEVDPEKKAKYYAMVEKVLGSAAELYEESGSKAKVEEVRQTLHKVEEEKELAISLTDILSAPGIMTSTSNFSLPTQNQESSVGLERFDHAEIRSTLTVSRGEVNVGEDVTLEIEAVNVGKGTALLMKIEEVAPESLEVISKPEHCRVVGTTLEIRGRKLEPLKTEEMVFGLKARKKGTFPLRPRIVFVDETGNQKSHAPAAQTISVKELGISGWISGRTR
jgi:hypothetical protein